MLTLKNISKSFMVNDKPVVILRDVNLEIKKGEKVAIIGPSGSGKTTLLSIMAGLDTPDCGEVIVQGVHLNTLNEQALAHFRNEILGVVFQTFELVAPFTALENVCTPLEIAGIDDTTRGGALLNSVALSERQEALPATLSGGEKQRVAIARALVRHPAVVLADEPTGSLDRVTGSKILELLLEQVTEGGATLIVITHDTQVSEKMDRVFELRDQTLHEIS